MSSRIHMVIELRPLGYRPLTRFAANGCEEVHIFWRKMQRFRLARATRAARGRAPSVLRASGTFMQIACICRSSRRATVWRKARRNFWHVF